MRASRGTHAGGVSPAVFFLPETEAVAEIHGLTLRDAEDRIGPNAHFRLIRSVIRGCGDGVDYERGSGGLVSESVFEVNRDEGIDLDADVAVVIERSVIRDNRQDGIEIRLMPWEGEVRKVVIRENHIHGNGEDGSSSSTTRGSRTGATGWRGTGSRETAWPASAAWTTRRRTRTIGRRASPRPSSWSTTGSRGTDGT